MHAHSQENKGSHGKKKVHGGQGSHKGEDIHACMTRLEIRDIRNRKAEPRREGTEIIADITECSPYDFILSAPSVV